MAELNSSESLTPAEAFREAVAIIGSQSATSRLIGLSQQAISDRINKGQACPVENGAVLKIEAATKQRGREISAHVLRPDVFKLSPPTIDPGELALETAGQSEHHATGGAA